MNPYKILGIEKDANAKEIRQAYKKKAQILHPDKETGSEEAFTELQEAYEILGDEKRRKIYDETGRTDKRFSNIDNLAAETIVHLFNMLLAKHECDIVDYVELIVEEIETAKSKLSREIASNKKQLDKLKLLATKLTFASDGENIIADSINQKITNFENTITDMELNLEIGDAALDLLNKYGFEGIQKIGQPGYSWVPTDFIEPRGFSKGYSHE